MTNKSMEDMPFCKFHMKIFSYASGSSFVDGYSLGIIAIALSMQNDFEMSVTMVGLLGMGTLAGMIIGGLVGGYFTDILGRKKMFIIDMLLLGVLPLRNFCYRSNAVSSVETVDWYCSRYRLSYSWFINERICA